MSGFSKKNGRLEVQPQSEKIGNVLDAERGDEVVTLGQLNRFGSTQPYKKYVAIMNQTSTNAPTATVLENTIGDIVWSYSAVGEYYATLAGAFTVGKTVVFLSNSANAGVTPSWTYRQISSADQIYILTMDNTDSNANGIFKGDIEIRVYY
jgi:hypothetical protein